MPEQSSEQLRTILDAAPLPLLISRLSDGKILYANQHLAALVDMVPEQMLGKDTPDFYADPADRAYVMGLLEKDEHLSGFEMRVKTSRGRVIWMILSAVVTEMDGQPVAVSGLYDIDRRKRAEEALRESENFVSAVLNTASALVVVLDTEGRIVRFNRACEKASGYKFEEVKDRPFWEVLILSEECEMVRYRFEALCEGKFPNSGENFWRTKTGDRRLISWSNTALTDELEKVEYIVATGIDITEKREAEAALCRSIADVKSAGKDLSDARNKLVQAEKMAALGNLMAGIAHEINTPVGAVTSMHDTLVRAVQRLEETLQQKFPEACEQDPKIQATLKVISDANRVIGTGTARVIQIVRSLRSFARQDGAEMKEADLHEGIENSLTLLHHDLKNRVEVIREYGALPPVPCFSNRLNQVFLNLLVNAAQAIDGAGRIVVKTDTGDGYARVSIQDTGTGIAEENLRKIFEPGFTTKSVGEGTGLGLSICRQIVEDHNGDILVESRAGEGTTFTLRVPLAVA